VSIQCHEHQVGAFPVRNLHKLNVVKLLRIEVLAEHLVALTDLDLFFIGFIEFQFIGCLFLVTRRNRFQSEHSLDILCSKVILDCIKIIAKTLSLILYNFLDDRRNFAINNTKVLEVSLVLSLHEHIVVVLLSLQVREVL